MSCLFQTLGLWSLFSGIDKKMAEPDEGQEVGGASGGGGPSWPSSELEVYDSQDQASKTKQKQEIGFINLPRKNRPP